MKTNKNSMIIKRKGYNFKLIKEQKDHKNIYINCDNEEERFHFCYYNKLN